MTTATGSPPAHRPLEPPTAKAGPFTLSIDPRESLLLLDIADDPTFAALEVQVFDDPLHGRGMLVLMAHHDGTVDCYREPALVLDPDRFSIGRGVGHWQSTLIEPAELVIADDGVLVRVGFTDADGRRVEVEIDDRDGAPRRRSTLLAPVGSGVEQPLSLFAVLMHEFDLGRATRRRPRIVIGGQQRRVASFPGPEWFHRRRFFRYSARPVIAVLNPKPDAEPAALEWPPGPADIAELEVGEGLESARLAFEPAFSDPRSLPNGARRAGTWALDVSQRALTGGSWNLVKDATSAAIELAVTEPWRPQDLPLSLRMVTTLARVFRTWPTTYRWTGEIDLSGAEPTMTSRWSRTHGPDRDNAYGVSRPGSRAVTVMAAAAALVALVVAGRRGRRTAAR